MLFVAVLISVFLQNLISKTRASIVSCFLNVDTFWTWNHCCHFAATHCGRVVVNNSSRACQSTLVRPTDRYSSINQVDTRHTGWVLYPLMLDQPIPCSQHDSPVKCLLICLNVYDACTSSDLGQQIFYRHCLDFISV